MPPRDERLKRQVAIKVLRSEEHTSELQSRSDLVCRLLLEKKKQNRTLQYCFKRNMSGMQCTAMTFRLPLNFINLIVNDYTVSYTSSTFILSTDTTSYLSA